MSIEVNHAAWIEKIKSELKGKDLHSFNYEWDGEKISPFEERVHINRTLSRKENNEWWIGSEIKSSIQDINAELLSQLEQGANAFHLDIDENKNWKKIFTGVHLDWISSEFQINSTSVWHELAPSLVQYAYESIQGVCWSDSEIQSELFSQYHSKLPGLKYLTGILNVTDSSKQISNLFRKLIDQITTLGGQSEASKILSNVAIKIISGEDLILNISMMRALRLVWMHILNSFNADPLAHHLYLSARIPYLKSLPSDQMISASLMATSMVLGGADAIFIADPDPKKGNSRWGLMAQHILREESMLYKEFDPFAGSFVIECLTGIIAEKVWNSI